jgi:DNA-3-methyladenine glycosylase II
MGDEEAVALLTEMPGVGKWTAEMFLIFCLKRPDVLSLGDAGLQRAAKFLYDSKHGENTLEGVSSIWRPYRSVASWYLWRHLD